MTPATQQGGDILAPVEAMGDNIGPAPGASRPSAEDVIAAICIRADKAGVACTSELATAVYRMLERAVELIRKGNYNGVFHLSGNDLRERHEVFDAVMPDDVTEPMAGSAHDLINRHFLQGDEFALVHTKSGTEVKFCAVQIELNRI